MRLRKMTERLLECVILSGKNKNRNALIPRMNLLHDKGGLPFTRLQFPVKLCYAMTIHKAQGQGYDYVGIDFSGTIFTHGLAYVAFSRCPSFENIRVYFGSTPKESYTLKNIVFQDLLQHTNPNNNRPPAPPVPSQPHPPLPEYQQPDPKLLDEPIDNDNDNNDPDHTDDYHTPPPSPKLHNHQHQTPPPRPAFLSNSSPLLSEQHLNLLRDFKQCNLDYEFAISYFRNIFHLHITRNLWDNV
jgi:hypothetical protein